MKDTKKQQKHFQTNESNDACARQNNLVAYINASA